MVKGVWAGEGVEAGEDITLSLCVPWEDLSFRLRNLLIVLMLNQVCITLPNKSLRRFIELSLGKEEGIGAAADASSIRDRCLTILTNGLWRPKGGLRSRD